MSLDLPSGIQINAPILPGFETILTRPALELVAKLHRTFEPRRQELLAARVERAKRLDGGERPDFPAETKAIRDGDWKIAPIPKALQCRRVEITGPGRRQDGHQRVQFGRRFVHDRLRGQQLAVVVEPDPGPDQHRQGDPPHADARADHRGRHQVLSPQREGRDAAGPAARLAPRREARADRRPAGPRRPVRLRALHVPQRQGAGRARLRPVLLPAEDREPPRGAALERRLRDDAERARPAAGHDQGDGADRDDPRGVRDGRDPLRAARAQRRPERGALGLHLQLHQEVQVGPQLLPGRPRQGDDDGAVHACLRAAAAADLPQARCPGDRRA